MNRSKSLLKIWLARILEHCASHSHLLCPSSSNSLPHTTPLRRPDKQPHEDWFGAVRAARAPPSRCFSHAQAGQRRHAAAIATLSLAAYLYHQNVQSVHSCLHCARAAPAYQAAFLGSSRTSWSTLASHTAGLSRCALKRASSVASNKLPSACQLPCTGGKWDCRPAGPAALAGHGRRQTPHRENMHSMPATTP